ncbi:uncharacterized protein L199_002086 [Kwoniella botswanensis]|uniref:uncharacterized protein n=1 Tax=Kwoniella botswanensis TaxID=1268659 RepID=UPI00315D2657
MTRGKKREREDDAEGVRRDDKTKIRMKSSKKQKVSHQIDFTINYPYSYNVENDHPRITYPTSFERNTNPAHHSDHHQNFPTIHHIPSVPSDTEQCAVMLVHIPKASSYPTSTTTFSSNPQPFNSSTTGRVGRKIELKRSSSSEEEGGDKKNLYVIPELQDEDDLPEVAMRSKDLLYHVSGEPGPGPVFSTPIKLPKFSNLAINSPSSSSSAESRLDTSDQTSRNGSSSDSSASCQMIITPQTRGNSTDAIAFEHHTDREASPEQDLCMGNSMFSPSTSLLQSAQSKETVSMLP